MTTSNRDLFELAAMTGDQIRKIEENFDKYLNENTEIQNRFNTFIESKSNKLDQRIMKLEKLALVTGFIACFSCILSLSVLAIYVFK